MNPIITACCIATLAVPATMSPASAQQEVPNRVYILPMDYDPSRVPFPIVRVSINGAEPLRFALDTGCSAGVVVTETTNKQLHLKAASERTNDAIHTGVKYREVRLDAARLCAENSANDISLSSGTDTGVKAFVLPSKIGQMLEEYRIAGLIGIPVLKAFSVARLDFEKKMLILGWYGKVTDSLKDPAELAFTIPSDERMHLTISAGATATTDMLVDTGSPSTLIDQDAAFAAGFTVTDVSHYANVAGVHQVVSGIASQLGLGKFGETEVECEVPTDGENLLGSDLLGRFQMTVDFQSNKMYLVKAGNYAERCRSRGADTVSLGEKGGQLFVTSVADGCAAWRAGIRKGDVLMSVNGAPVAGLPVLSAHLLLEGFAGQSAVIGLQRGGILVQAEYHIELYNSGSDQTAAVKLNLKHGGVLSIPNNDGSRREVTIEAGKITMVVPGTTVHANSQP